MSEKLREHLRIIWAIATKDIVDAIKNKTTLSVIGAVFFLMVFYQILLLLNLILLILLLIQVYLVIILSIFGGLNLKIPMDIQPWAQFGLLQQMKTLHHTLLLIHYLKMNQQIFI